MTTPWISTNHGFIEQNKNRPWFCYLAFNAVQAPLQAPDDVLQRFNDPKRQTYAAMQSSIDDAVGSVLSKLRELNLEEDTLNRTKHRSPLNAEVIATSAYRDSSPTHSGACPESDLYHRSKLRSNRPNTAT
jgi:hypothetical protein